MKFIFLFLFTTATSPLFLSSQCQVHMVELELGTDNIIIPRFAGNLVGQVFVACEDGVVSSISFGSFASQAPFNSSGNILRIAELGTPPILPTGVIGGPAYQTFDINIPGTGTVSQGNLVNLAIPFPVTNGKAYVFELEFSQLTNVFVDNDAINGGDYPDGIFYGADNAAGLNWSGTTGTAADNSDLDFSVQIVPATVIPTMGQWGVFILALLLITGALVVLRKKVIA